MKPISAFTASIVSLALVTVGAACNTEPGANGSDPGLQGANVFREVANPAELALPLSGEVTFSRVTKEDASVMTDEELAAAIAQFPTLGVNLDQLQAAKRGEVAANGTVTLFDADNVLILTVPVGGVGTIRSVVVSGGGSNEQGQCANWTLTFALSDSTQPPAEQGQDAPPPIVAGFHAILDMLCVNPKPDPKPEPKPSSKP